MSHWFNKGSGTVLKFGGRVLKFLMPPDTWRFKFSDPTADPSSITPTNISCASTYTWTQIDNNGTWDCLVTKKEGYYPGYYDNSLYYCFDSVFNSNNFPDCTVDLVEVPDTSNIEITIDMFSRCNILTSVPLFDTSNVTSMSEMFDGCNSLTSVPMFDTSSVVSMHDMFSFCKALSKVPMFDTSNVTDMSGMFDMCESLVSVPLFNTSNVTSMRNMLSSCRSLSSVPLFDTAKVTDMSGMLEGCGIRSVPLFNTSSVTNMSDMFYFCRNLETVPIFDTSNVTNMGSMFKYCENLLYVPLLDTSSVIYMSQMFNNCWRVQGGALALYQQASSQANPPSTYDLCFHSCGQYTATGAAELAQIPSSWGGTANG